ncbi:uncharacterized protein BDV17DRAFT_287148 [Aspergillus undulatus]|uniref:uncharacterized protein n=1 Tax=Aspergillus undulatus TaxID=1810928 RepID=UPI003CCD56F6
MPGQQPMQMGMNDPNQQVTMQQRQQQQQPQAMLQMQQHQQQDQEPRPGAATELRSGSVSVIDIGNTNVHGLDEVPDAEGNYTNPENVHYYLTNVANSLQTQDSFRGWRAEVGVRERVFNVHKLVTSIRLIDPQISFASVTEVSEKYEERVFREAASKVKYDKELKDRVANPVVWLMPGGR